MSRQYYLRDTRSNVGSNAQFWANAGGYTTNLNDAEVFTEENALRQHRSRETDLPVAVDFITGKTRQRVDCQWLEASPTLRDADKHVVIVGGQFDGNDVLFVGDNGQTFELDEAKVFELEEGCILAATNYNYRIYPYDDIKAISRLTVNAAHVLPKACAKYAGFNLIEPPKPRKPVYHCHGCGVFMSEYQFYASDCRRCGVSNRP
ncbi:hypothetical protein JAO78_005335 [Alishewanella sp. 16-MA]|uniref:Uncharacterized protein n=1 Tax=Alishewanella maricola TaxID=2795740 RepID=A0ABS8C2K4_9ALTE|nr:hypothetical protein [Alishewanella maricola]MCB5226235.1 hypothetical protein [Alishewanella maricola]